MEPITLRPCANAFLSNTFLRASNRVFPQPDRGRNLQVPHHPLTKLMRGRDVPATAAGTAALHHALSRASTSAPIRVLGRSKQALGSLGTTFILRGVESFSI